MSIVFSYLPFASTNYLFSAGCFQSIGYDPPYRATVTDDIKTCAVMVANALKTFLPISPCCQLNLIFGLVSEKMGF